MSTKISESVDVHALPSVALRAYWVLDYFADTKGRLASSAIAKYLVERVGIKATRQAIDAALSKSIDVDKNEKGYKLMQSGIKKLAQHAVKQAPGCVFIDAGRPFSATRKVLREIVGTDYSVLNLFDPYVDVRTLDTIFSSFLPAVPVRVLTIHLKDQPQGIFTRQLATLNAEGFCVEVRVINQIDVHDRYIMTDKDFWLSGNSLNYLGSKESFFVRLGDDIRTSMRIIFEERWQKANRIN